MHRGQNVFVAGGHWFQQGLRNPFQTGCCGVTAEPITALLRATAVNWEKNQPVNGQVILVTWK